MKTEAADKMNNHGTFSNGTVVYNLELRDGKIDAVLPFYFKEEKIVERAKFWIDHLKNR
jgi:hypothetical protein